MVGWKDNKNMKKIDGWLDGQKTIMKKIERQNRWMVGWIKQIYGWLEGQKKIDEQNRWI